ncbi:MAG: DUF898 family protein [Thermodesulfobacteriota bacterium]
MHIVCPECGKDHAVPDEKLPAQKFNAICRDCKAKFMVEVASCLGCGSKKQEGHPCPCGVVEPQKDLEVVKTAEGAREAVPAPSGVEQQDEQPLEGVKEEPQLRPEFNQTRDEHTLQFTGTGQEFFRIWIVNLFLTIITLGIYAAWAKVRTRQYFYSHTSCAGEPFDYLADPMIILRGNLIIGGGFIIYSISNAFTPLISSVIAMMFGLLFPYLVFKSLRFFARNSAYRNIRFHFLGSVEESYITYLLLPILIPFTLGLVLPYWGYRRKKYFFENFAFGSHRNAFSGIPGDFYKIYMKAFLIVVLPVIVVFSIIGGMVMAMDGSSGEAMSGGMIALVVIAYLGFFLTTIFAQQYVYAKTTNYCWKYSSMGAVKFRSTLDAGKLMWIRMTNIIALIVSAGLLFPWTKVRQSKYIFENLTIITYQGLDDFTAGEEDSEDALGEAAMDFFDFEVGL